MKKKIIFKILGLIFLNLFNYDSTILMESEIENEQKENNLITKNNESWWSWIKDHKIEILIFSGLLVLIPLFFYDNNSGLSTIPDLNLLVQTLEPLVNNIVYSEFLSVITEIKKGSLDREEGIEILEKMLTTYSEYPSLVNNSEKFQKIVLKIINEIIKKN